LNLSSSFDFNYIWALIWNLDYLIVLFSIFEFSFARFSGIWGIFVKISTIFFSDSHKTTLIERIFAGTIPIIELCTWIIGFIGSLCLFGTLIIFEIFTGFPNIRLKQNTFTPINNQVVPLIYYSNVQINESILRPHPIYPNIFTRNNYNLPCFSDMNVPCSPDSPIEYFSNVSSLKTNSKKRIEFIVESSKVKSICLKEFEINRNFFNCHALNPFKRNRIYLKHKIQRFWYFYESNLVESYILYNSLLGNASEFTMNISIEPSSDLLVEESFDGITPNLVICKFEID
jgi:hypothetical protein